MCHPSEAQLIRRHAQANCWKRTAPNNEWNQSRSKRLWKTCEFHYGPNKVQNEGRGLRSDAVTQDTARRTSPSSSSKFSSHRSKTRTRQSFAMTESETEHPSDYEAVAKGVCWKHPMKCSRSKAERRFVINRSHPLRRSLTKSSVRNDSSDSSSSDTKASERRPKKTHFRGSEVKKTKPPPDWDSSSSSDTESHVRTEKPKYLIKPLKYDETSSLIRSKPF